MTAPISKILIANRGEIACRVIRTAKKMGITTVAVYSDADVDALHVAMADESIHIGPSAASESYLIAEYIIAAAKVSDADAIHPGYGFLSENPDFAEMCSEHDIIFIGPSATSMRAMALKGAAKKLMIEAGVPVVPGYHGDDQSDGVLQKAADDMGYPVLIKAVAGGGGKGMRTVFAPKDFASALAAARREGENSFGNDKVLIEKLIQKPRHIEVQVFGDNHGNAVHLFERDCSLQRRHQKVVEEAPAPGLSDAQRREMGDAAVRAAKAINYSGAGTIEFIVDVAGGIEAAEFYFMEMNTRLQVEHPVTEMITGTDLVEWQIRVASGDPLPLTQDEITLKGHAVEVRLYAEDPNNDFLPATGLLENFDIPQHPNTRLETGVLAGDSVSIHYDPMIAKLVAYGDTRSDAIANLKTMMAGSVITGLKNNSDFLYACINHPEFTSGDVDTGFIARNEANLIVDHTPAERERALASLAILAAREERSFDAALATGAPDDPWGYGDNFMMNLPSTEVLLFKENNDSDITVHATHDNGSVRLNEGNSEHMAAINDYDDGWISANLDGYSFKYFAAVHETSVTLILPDRTIIVPRHALRLDSDDETAGSGQITAPMPGKILQVIVADGDEVVQGDALLVMEAMKMEQTLTAPCSGTVTDLSLKNNDQVSDGQILLNITPEES